MTLPGRTGSGRSLAIWRTDCDARFGAPPPSPAAVLSLPDSAGGGSCAPRRGYKRPDKPFGMVNTPDARILSAFGAVPVGKVFRVALVISVCMLGGAGGGSGKQLGHYYLNGAACAEPEVEPPPEQARDMPGLDDVPQASRVRTLRYYATAEQLSQAWWFGGGAARVGLTGKMDESAMRRFADLLDGTLDGQQIARPVWRESDDSHLDVETLLGAVRQAAQARGITVDALFAHSAVAAVTYAELRRRTSGGRDWVRADVARELCVAAGLDAQEVFRSKDGTDRLLAAEMHIGERENVRRLGIDLTVSAPKSVSTLAAVATDPRVVDAIVRCHTLATGEAFGYLQRHAGHAFRGHHGDGQQMSTIGTAGWIGAAFTHHTSRADDPQLHTHLVIANVLCGDDGRWSAVDSRAVYRHAKTAGFLYQAALRHHLSEQLGISWTDVVKGVAEIDGIPQSVLTEFSTRRRDILKALNTSRSEEVDENVGIAKSASTAPGPPRLGVLTRGRRRAAQAACLATRPAKTHLTREQLRSSWRERAARQGLTSVDHLLHPVPIPMPKPVSRPAREPQGRPLEVVPRSSRPAPACGPSQPPRAEPVRSATGLIGMPTPTLEELAARLFGPEGLTLHKTDFDARDVVQALCEQLPSSATGDALTVEWLAAQLLDHPNAIRLTDEAGTTTGVRGPIYSSRDLVATEQRALSLAGSSIGPLQADREALGLALAQTGDQLSQEQRAAVIRLANDPRLATVLVGPAGSGKTAALATLRTYWTVQRRPVIGVALAALTAQRLQASSGIPSSSLAALLHQLDTPDLNSGQATRLPAGAVVVVDEAGMVGTRDLTRLLEHTHAAGGTVLLVGDPAQLGEIDAGGLFRHLAQPARRPAELTSNQRQIHAWEQQALLDLRRGHTRRAVEAYAAHDRIRTGPDRDSVRQQLAADYLASDRTGSSVAVLAACREDVGTLNTLIRRGLQVSGALPPDELRLPGGEGGLALAVGDQLLSTRNVTTAAGRRLFNGTRLTVTAADKHTITVTDGKVLHVLDHATAGTTLQHGYATTIHKAQGVTVDHALVLADGLTAESGYTALSRGRQTNVLYRTSDGDPRPDLTAELSARSGDQLALPRVAPGGRTGRLDLARKLPAHTRTLDHGPKR